MCVYFMLPAAIWLLWTQVTILYFWTVEVLFSLAVLVVQETIYGLGRYLNDGHLCLPDGGAPGLKKPSWFCGSSGSAGVGQDSELRDGMLLEPLTS